MRRQFYVQASLLWLCVAATLLFGLQHSFAAASCSTEPKSKFQDRAKLDDMLKPKGLMINKILEDHGCYKVIAVTRKYKKSILYFNAATLAPVDMNAKASPDASDKSAEADGD